MGVYLVFDRMNSKSFDCNSGVALSPRISVQRILSAKTTSMKDMVAKFVRGQQQPAMAYAMA